MIVLPLRNFSKDRYTRIVKQHVQKMYKIANLIIKYLNLVDFKKRHCLNSAFMIKMRPFRSCGQLIQKKVQESIVAM